MKIVRRDLVVKTSVMTGGVANEGIFKHNLTPAELDASFSLVEKRIARTPKFETEFEICRRVSTLTSLGKSAHPLPSIIATFASEKQYSVIMLYYDNVGLKLDDWRRHGQLIGKAVAKLNTTKLDIPKENALQKLAMNVKNISIDNEKLNAFSKNVMKLCENPVVDSFGNEEVKSHNDLYFPNIATQQREGEYDIVFIDLGHIAYNDIGADFHHFVRAAVLEHCPMEMLDVIFDTYAGIVKKEKFLVALNAHRFALLRLTERLRGYCSVDKELKFTNELNIGYKILDSAQTIVKNLENRAA